MKQVYITANRNFDIEGKMFGRKGTYTVTDKVAKNIVNSGRGNIVQDLGEDEPEAQTYEQMQAKQEFLNNIRDNAGEIIAILDEYHYKSKEAEKEEKHDKSEADSGAGAKSTDKSEKEPKAPDSDENNGHIEPSATSLEDDQADKNDAQSGSEEQKGANKTQTVDESTGAGKKRSEVAGTPLPDKFPAKDTLEAAGITTVEGIPTDPDKLVEIEGMNDRSVKAVLTKLSNMEKK